MLLFMKHNCIKSNEIKISDNFQYNFLILFLYFCKTTNIKIFNLN